METTLDYIDGIKVKGHVFNEPVNEYWALLYLRDGLYFLAHQVAECEKIVRQRINPERKLRILMMGRCPELSGLPIGLISCAFHWYAVSACQYVRTVGTIAYNQDDTRQKPDNYVDSVIPEVRKFRDKVAAHFAWTMRSTHDNIAERGASIIPQLKFIDDTFSIAGYEITRHSNGKTTKADLEGWSITNIHKCMCDRYWRS